MELSFLRFRENDALYKIAAGGKDLFYIKRYSHKLDWGFTLSDASGGEELFSIYKKFNVFKTIFEIKKGENVVFSEKFSLINLYETRIAVDNISYDIFRHKGLNWSVFKDGKQVAAITKQSVEINNESYINIKSCKNENQSHIAVALLFIVLIAYSEIDSPSFGSKKSHDLGYFGRETMVFNENWHPA